ncbi:MAG: clostripain-related cysteine peptidase [Syntrophales bacterium]
MCAGELPSRPLRAHPLDHGSGWWEDAKSRAADPAGRRPRHNFSQAHCSSCYDDTSGDDALGNRELRVVLAGICTLLDRKIGLLGMGAYLMNMVEVSRQLRDSVKVIVGSEIEEPFDGWPYAKILSLS